MKKSVTRGKGLLEKFLSEKRAEWACKVIPPVYREGRILDIGCGSYPLFLLKVKFLEKYGLDKNIEKSAISYFKKKNIFLFNYDIEKPEPMPFKDKYFDVVSMLAVLEHIEPSRLVKVLSETRRILKIGGMLIITTPAYYTHKLLKFMAQLKLVSKVEIEEHKDTYSHQKIISLLQKANFSEKKIKFGYFEFYMNLWITGIK